MALMAGGNADAQWREKIKKEEEDRARTVESLRGRLLKERVVSRIANLEAQNLGEKLIELENMLREESKSRNRAEKKLKVLKKKLESMNITYVSDESEQSELVNSSVSCIHSSSTAQFHEKGEIGSDRLEFINPISCNNSKMDEQSVKDSADEGCDQEGSNNSMALILIEPVKKNEVIDPEVVQASVKEVLEALRRAKEQLQSSMEKKRMKTIKVG